MARTLTAYSTDRIAIVSVAMRQLLDSKVLNTDTV